MAGPDAAIVGALTALIAIFLPGLLLVAGALPLWQGVARHPAAGSVIAGVNASVVGLLGAALYNPIWTSTVRDWTDFSIALVGLVLLLAWRVSALFIVIWCVCATVVISLI